MIDDATEESVGRFIKMRMGQVSRTQVTNDLDVLRRVLEFAIEERLLKRLPHWKVPPVEDAGTPVPTARKAAALYTEEQVEAMISALPEFTSRSRFPIRDFVILLWETGLRPLLWLRVRPLAQKHWKLGGMDLNITEDIDKLRWARVVRISPRAREALERCWGHATAKGKRNPHGFLFCDGNGEPMDSGGGRSGSTGESVLGNAALTALGEGDLAEDVNISVFRKARITHWLNYPVNGKMVPRAQVQYCVGHRKSATTDLYDKTSFHHQKDMFGDESLVTEQVA
jgi:integrase